MAVKRSTYLWVGGLLVAALVLLLILVLKTAPILSTGAAVELPRTNAQTESSQEESITVDIDSEGAVFIQDKKVSFDDLAAHLMTLSDSDYTKRIYLHAGQNSEYSDVMKVMTHINKAGFAKISLVTESTDP